MNKLKYLLFIFICFCSFNVFAQDFTISSSDISSPQGGGTTGTYSGTEIYNTGSNNVYYLGTRYSGRLSRIIFNLVAGGYADTNGFEKGHTYTLTMNMATEDWRNNFGSVSVKCEGSSGTELSNGHVTYVSYKKIKFSFTAPTNSWCRFVYIDLKSTSISSIAFTGTSNWNLSSLVISDPSYSSSGSGSSTPTPSNDYSSIINNQNENTENIINNQNQNTNDIIENANDNTDKITDSIDNINYICKKSVTKNDIKFTQGAYLENNGSLISLSNYYYTSDFIKVSGDTITFLNITGPNYHLLYYNSDRNLITSGVAINSTSYSLPIGTTYIRFSINETNYNNFSLSSSGCIYLDRDSITNDKLDNINDTLTDDTSPDINFIDVEVTSDTPITDLLLMPFTILNKLVDVLDDDNTCVNYVLPFDFFGGNNTITFPCFTLSDYIGNYANLVDGLFCLVMLYQIGMMCVTIFNDITSLRDGFDGLYSPKHHDTSSRVGRGEMEGRY